MKFRLSPVWYGAKSGHKRARPGGNQGGQDKACKAIAGLIWRVDHPTRMINPSAASKPRKREEAFSDGTQAHRMVLVPGPVPPQR